MGACVMVHHLSKTLIAEPVAQYVIIRPKYTVQNLYSQNIDVDTVWSVLNDGAKYDAIPADDINNLAPLASVTIEKGEYRKSIPALGVTVDDILQAALIVKRSADAVQIGTDTIIYTLTIAGKFGHPTVFDFDLNTMQNWLKSDDAYVDLQGTGAYSNPYCVRCRASTGYLHFYRNINFLALGSMSYCHLRAWEKSWHDFAGTGHAFRIQLWDNDLGSEIAHWDRTVGAGITTEALASYYQHDYDILSHVQGNDNVQVRIGSLASTGWYHCKVDDVEIDCVYA